MRERIDLHLHTSRSDGVCEPYELLELVRKRALKAFAVADHDTLSGYEAVRDLLEDGDPELVPAVELSCSSPSGDLHMLGYLFDAEDETLNNTLTEFQKNRNQRGHLMVQRLNDLGVEVTMEAVAQCADGAAIGRPHVAQAIFEQKYVHRYEDAFRKYIGDNAPAFVPKTNYSPAQAIELIHVAGGLAVLAHPMINATIRQVDELTEMGLDGIEVYHPLHKQSEIDKLKHVASEHNLVCTGGSDFHGREGRYGAVGSEAVPAAFLDAMKARVTQQRGAV